MRPRRAAGAVARLRPGAVLAGAAVVSSPSAGAPGRALRVDNDVAARPSPIGRKPGQHRPGGPRRGQRLGKPPRPRRQATSSPHGDGARPWSPRTQRPRPPLSPTSRPAPCRWTSSRRRSVRAAGGKRPLMSPRFARLGSPHCGSASRCSQARPLRSPPSDESDAGLFEEAFVVLGVDRWPFDHARVQLLYGESACGGPRKVTRIASASTHCTRNLRAPWSTTVGEARRRRAPSHWRDQATCRPARSGSAHAAGARDRATRGFGINQ